MYVHLPLQYDSVSPKARISPIIKTKLERLFAEVGKRPWDCFLRITNSLNSQTARSTTYVLCEGVVDSPLCFQLSKYRTPPQVWITPNGWKTATVASSQLFTAEAKIVEGEMQYRFGLVHLEDGGESRLGEWQVKLQTAFACLDQYIADAVKPTLVKTSKETVIAVHTVKVQHALHAAWEAQKLEMTEQELLMCQMYENHATMHPMDECPKVTSSSSSPRDDGILTPQEIGMMLSTVEDKEVSHSILMNILLLLEAGAGARMDYFLHFLQLIEACADRAWSHTSNVALQCLCQHETKAQHTLAFRAFIFVFARLAEMDMQAGEIKMHTTSAEFCRRITELPRSDACAACFQM